MQDTHQVFSNPKYSIRQYRNLKGKNSIHHKKIEREETPYDPTILAKLVVHQDRAKSRTQERERERSNTELLIHTLSLEDELLTHHHENGGEVGGDGDGGDVPGGVPAPPDERGKGPPPYSSSLALRGERELSPRLDLSVVYYFS